MKILVNKRGLSSLAGLLIVLIIICLLMLILLPRYLGRSSRGEEAALRKMGVKKPKTPAGAIRIGHEVECMSNLRQIRGAIEMYHSSEDYFPSSLEELVPSYLDKSFLKCSASGEKYLYDSKTGTVQCPHPGHEKF